VPALWAMAAPILAAAAPFLALAGIAAIVALGIMKLVKHADEIKKALGDAWSYVKEKAQAFWDWLSSLPGRAIEALEDLGHAIVQAFVDAWEKVKQVVSDAVHWIGKKIKSIPGVGRVIGWLSGPSDDAKAGASVPATEAPAVGGPGVNVDPLVAMAQANARVNEFTLNVNVARPKEEDPKAKSAKSAAAK